MRGRTSNWRWSVGDQVWCRQVGGNFSESVCRLVHTFADTVKQINCPLPRRSCKHYRQSLRFYHQGVSTRGTSSYVRGIVGTTNWHLSWNTTCITRDLYLKSFLPYVYHISYNFMLTYILYSPVFTEPTFPLRQPPSRFAFNISHHPIQHLAQTLSYASHLLS